MAEGVTHISLPTQEYDRGKQEKTKQTNKHEQSLGLTKSRGRYCNTTCMCGLSLAWVTSENSTMLLESDILRLFFTGPYLVSSPLCSVSGVDCPSVDPRQLLCSPLSCPVSTAFSLLSSHQLPLLVSCHQLSLCSPATNSHSRVQPPTLSPPVQLPTLLSSGSRRQLSFASPYHFRVRRDFMSKNPLSGFAPKQTRLLWRPTPIVLQKDLFNEESSARPPRLQTCEK